MDDVDATTTTPEDADRRSTPRFARSLETRSRAYDTVARAIRYLEQHAQDAPTLADLAQAIGPSPSHLQRLFSDWAGISPKRFLQVMAVLRARRALRQHDVLAASYEAGLSGPGRLHDLVVACEALTPGELRSGGAGVEIRWGLGATPLGLALVGSTARGVCHLEFVLDGAAVADRLRQTWPRATLTADPQVAPAVLGRVFGADRPPRSLHLLVKGTNFQVQVWRALLALPVGAITTYGGLAQALDRPNSARAVAGAVAHNHIGILIPCHRVLRASGHLGGYRWGVERKLAALVLESLP